ncbi:MAG: hypothetical protein IKO48_07340 [Elusimicrobia bacterium]|nr:hypothetical protein [Elusimicrobiota bacterium]
MIKFLSISLCFIFIFFASIKSDVFHREKCHYVSRIKIYNLISFDTYKQAIKSGYRPCKVCRPQE